ncbi:hypothetical protein C8R44DRAFT_862079 [Mycena epipterygia]|nr:hypothetical protein C8R44DRAFT_862079 [Mycena epipterygia]
MRQLIVRYDDRGTSKTLPKRGALFASGHEALASHWMQWALLNFALFLSPAMTGLFRLLFVLSCSGAHGISRDEFAYVFTYFSVSAGTSLVFIGKQSLTRQTTYGIYGNKIKASEITTCSAALRQERSVDVGKATQEKACREKQFEGTCNRVPGGEA